MLNSLKALASANSNSKNHPLESSSGEDSGGDEDTDDITSQSSSLIASNQKVTEIYESTLEKLNAVFGNQTQENQAPPAPPKREKRQAPKIPDLKPVVKNSTFLTIVNNEEKFTKFYIYIDQVRWFYKGDKKSLPKPPSATSSTQNQTSQTNLNTSSTNLSKHNSKSQTDLVNTLNSISLNQAQANESSNKNLQSPNPNDMNNNIFNTAKPQNLHHISSKKWYMFNKFDSYNLECEYRDMITKQNMMNVTAAAGSKPVQVLENLYEVNLETRKCYSIYWKSRICSVKRCIWFSEAGEPLDEKTSEEIEKKHVSLFKDSLVKDLDPLSSSPLASIDQKQQPSIPTVATSTSINELDQQQLQNDKFYMYSYHSDQSKPQNANAPVIADPIPKAIDSLTIDEGTVTWYSKDDIFWAKNKLGLFDMMSFGISRIRNKISGVKIKRGYKETNKEEINQKPKEITHLVFVVHGIAQKLYENSVFKNCDDIRQGCEKKKKEYFSSHEDQQFIFLPVDWRSQLVLDDGIVESITPKSIQTIRDKINSSVLDIMYYTSPVFRSEIMYTLTFELNRLYRLFCSKNPSFKQKHNKVSFVAHSLGTVIMYDILTSNTSVTQFSNNYGADSNHQQALFNHLSNNDNKLLDEYLICKKRMQEIEKNLIKTNTANMTILDFKPVNMFNLGSPLPLFLALREGVRPAGIGSQEHILPKHLCKHLFNIFHPSDPIAYRLEPLILKHYATKSPVDLQKLPESVGKLTYKELNEKRSALNIDLKTMITKNKKDKGKKDTSKDTKSAELTQLMKDEITNSVAVVTSAASSVANTLNNMVPSIFNATKNNQPIDQVELETALDYRLQDSNFEVMAILNAHFIYWTSPETALFIVQQLCRNQDEQ